LAGRGKARQGKARQGKARQGFRFGARQGAAGQGQAGRGEARQGKARQGKARILKMPNLLLSSDLVDNAEQHLADLHKRVRGILISVEVLQQDIKLLRHRLKAERQVEPDKAPSGP
jgi:hypothetical protein